MLNSLNDQRSCENPYDSRKARSDLNLGDELLLRSFRMADRISSRPPPFRQREVAPKICPASSTHGSDESLRRTSEQSVSAWRRHCTTSNPLISGKQTSTRTTSGL